MQILFAPAYISFVFMLALAMNESVYLFQSPARRAYTATRNAITTVVLAAQWRPAQVERPIAAPDAKTRHDIRVG
jgi:hypothetical protein